MKAEPLTLQGDYGHRLEIAAPRIYASANAHYFSLHGTRGPMVTIDLDTGGVTFGADYSLDEAARSFWSAVGLMMPKLDRTAVSGQAA